jgi:hypothetical protein
LRARSIPVIPAVAFVDLLATLLDEKVVESSD